MEKDSNVSSNNMKAMNKKIEKIQQLDARNMVLESMFETIKYFWLFKGILSLVSRIFVYHPDLLHSVTTLYRR